MVHSNVQKVEHIWQDSMVVQGTPEWPEMQKGITQKVEAGKDYPGGKGDFYLTIFKRARKKMQGAAGQSASPHSLKTVMQTFLEATSKHMKRHFITTWIMHNLSRSPGSNKLEGTSDTLGVGLPFRVMRTGRKNSAARILMKLKATTKSCIWDGVTCETVQLGVGGRPLQKGHVGPGGCLKVEHRSAVCPCGKEG